MPCRAACEDCSVFSCGAARITSYHHRCVVLGNHVKIVSVPTLANECVRLSAQRLRHHHAAFTPAGTAPYTAAGSNFATAAFAGRLDFRRRLVVGVAPPIGDVVVAPKSSSSRPPCGIPNASKHTSSAASSAAASAASAAAVPASTCIANRSAATIGAPVAPVFLPTRRFFFFFFVVLPRRALGGFTPLRRAPASAPPPRLRALLAG